MEGVGGGRQGDWRSSRHSRERKKGEKNNWKEYDVCIVTEELTHILKECMHKYWTIERWESGIERRCWRKKLNSHLFSESYNIFKSKYKQTHIGKLVLLSSIQATFQETKQENNICHLLKSDFLLSFLWWTIAPQSSSLIFIEPANTKV